MPTIVERLRRTWNAFLGRDPTKMDLGLGSSYPLDKQNVRFNNARTIVTTIHNRIAVDVAAIDFKHVMLNEVGNFKEEIKSELNNCLSIEANIDQTGRAFIQDAVMSMFDEGHVALVPTYADTNATHTEVLGAEVYNLRVGKVKYWYPQAVTVEVYNDMTGKREEVTLPKTMVAIAENPFYAIMNEPNSTLQRLINTMAKLDKANDQNTAGKLDLIVQLPYIVKSETRKAQAERRRTEIEEQLTNSKYGVAYTDGTEKIVQLNRSLENNLLDQVNNLKQELYNQLGLTEAVFNGTASEQEMLNYKSRTIKPICLALAEAMERRFLTKTARTQGQAIRFFDDPFELAPVSQIAEMSDKFTRNEIMSSNEIRAKLGMKPSDDPKADALVNSNLNQTPEQLAALEGNPVGETPEGQDIPPEESEEVMNETNGATGPGADMSFDQIRAFIKSGGKDTGG